MDNRPIGVFDSGLGGLTVVRQLTELLPREDIVYFGDCGRVPYGTRSRETIEKYALQDGRFLCEKNVKAIIAACGTVSSVASCVLRKFDRPALGVVDAAAKTASSVSRSGKIGVIGTVATVRSEAFKKKVEEIRSDARVTSIACPLFVPLVENGWIDPRNPVTSRTADIYLRPLREAGIDALILGCTHFPLLSPIIERILPGVTLVDAGREAAIRCVRLLKDRNLLAERREKGSCRFFVSDRTEDFTKIASMFLGRPIKEDTERVCLETVETGAEIERAATVTGKSVAADHFAVIEAEGENS